MSQHTFLDVTEQPAEQVTEEQVARLYSRYHWARGYCSQRDVLEVACGSGLGLTYLAQVANTLQAGDASDDVFALVHGRLGDKFDIRQFPAERLPFPDRSLDVVILFEALYYLDSPELFVMECRRVLRPGGFVLISTANKDLFDFTPSIFSRRYLGVVELHELFARGGFKSEFFGDSAVSAAGALQRMLRPVKRLATRLGLIPKTMRGKRFLKRLVFGGLVTMPSEIREDDVPDILVTPLAPSVPDRQHKVIFCAARLEEDCPARTAPG